MLVKEQLSVLESFPHSFEKRVWQEGQTITGLSVATFQMNIGKWCNQACKHCHVDASPIRTELMSLETIDLCLEIIRKHPNIQIVDITGGAPEGNPHFRYLVTELSKLNVEIIDRCNLTILLESGYEDLAEFLAEKKVSIYSSLPFYSKSFTDKQRGDGVFEKSIQAMKLLNRFGYGKDLPFHLVYNPVGLFLSGDQNSLEKEFKEHLSTEYGVFFHNLFAINNLPINRFLAALVKNGKYLQYMETLSQAFNPNTLNGLMCRHQISVGYDGTVYDCDFNQMLELPSRPVKTIKDFDWDLFLNREIRLANHCYGCTAGAGSSCGGALA
ncbi:Fe-S oxidoreductase [Leptospira ryugenii]|uniref:Fe-S oxidoreductase n=1 Tax=Leptospira ryugenii TaxID=1917863 RepID=A0A2P2E2J7_9LEPT|nr:arsenosugar biosynthesis radical SAM (seleno)protein ArsS [Leptospira ryugenii]GBF51036.1 Fe-S oxidoreductase [Leptospira ryugenii]